jgi:hypothetical protein
MRGISFYTKSPQYIAPIMSSTNAFYTDWRIWVDSGSRMRVLSTIPKSCKKGLVGYTDKGNSASSIEGFGRLSWLGELEFIDDFLLNHSRKIKQKFGTRPKFSCYSKFCFDHEFLGKPEVDSLPQRQA